MNSCTSFSALKNQEKEYRKKFIADVAVKMFVERPFNQITLRSIADEVGITPAAIYSYFPDKNDLFAEVYVVSGDSLMSEFNEMISDNRELSVKDVALKYVSHFHDGTGKGRHFNIILQFMLDESISSAQWEKINATNRLFTNLIAEFFRTLNADAEVKMLAQSFIAALNGVLLTAKNYPKKKDKEILEHIKARTALIAELFEERIKRRQS